MSYGRLQQAYALGRQAYAEGEPPSHNPYSVTWKEWGAWHRGYFSWAKQSGLQ